MQVWLGWSAVGLRVGSLESLTLMGGNNLGGGARSWILLSGTRYCSSAGQ